MKKNDWIIVAILVALMFAWMQFYPALEKKYFPKPEPEKKYVVNTTSNVSEASPKPSVPPEIAKTILQDDLQTTPKMEQPSVPEQRLPLSSEKMELRISSHGGAIVSAVLKDYPAKNVKNSGPLLLDFASAPALRYDRLPVSSGTIETTDRGLLYTATLGDGHILKRLISLQDNYLLTVEDSFINDGKTPWVLPELRLPTGPMSNPDGTTAMRGLSSLGVDTFVSVDGIQHWGRQFSKIFRNIPVSADPLVSTSEMMTFRSIDWVAAKNKFFVQILQPDISANGFDLSVRREREGKKIIPVEVSTALQFDSESIAKNETFIRTTHLYIGPKNYFILKTLGLEQTEVMGFKSDGFWKFMNPVMFPIKTGLLWGLMALHKIVRNYGVAIMLLTIIVRIIFWPITHKGTESMRKMQTLQPQLKEIREKYKDNPQRMQQETMSFYKENKVNPMGGCLPIFIQLPVLIALFTILRSAIELRFSKFLWIHDLSEPENLFAGMIPIVGTLNILPILMAATMIWQQRLTPAAGDPQQQKVMAIMMPVMMLFFFYNMPSGLILYWTTSQLLMIIQMLIKKKKEA